MTTATTQTTRTRRRPQREPDLSYLLSRNFKDNPDFLLAAVKVGGLISCSVCRRVIGVGPSKETAIADGLREGTAFPAGSEYVCEDHHDAGE